MGDHTGGFDNSLGAGESDGGGSGVELPTPVPANVVADAASIFVQRLGSAHLSIPDLEVHYSGVFVVESDLAQIAKPGDSGALIADRQNRPIGMVVAGHQGKSQKPGAARPYAVVQPLYRVLQDLGLAVDEGR